ncbi:MAG: polysaccharide biosynthesis tyrosine autokinase [Pirellulaceae bacterium]
MNFPTPGPLPHQTNPEPSNQLLPTGDAPPMLPDNSWLQSGSAWLDHSQQDEGINLVGFFHSIRRQWLPGTLLGLVTAAAMALILWLLIPINFEAQGLLRVKRNNQDWTGELKYESERDYNVYKQTQSALIKSTYVLNAALRKPGIKSLTMLAREDYPLAFLEEELKAQYAPESEILTVGLKGDNIEDPVKIVDAVMEAFLEEVQQSDQTEQTRRLEQLRAAERKNLRAIQDKKETILKLARELGTKEDEQAAINQRVEFNKLNSLNMKRDALQGEYMDAVARLRMLQTVIQNQHVNPSEHEIEDHLESDPRYAEMKMMVGELKRQYNDMSQSRGANSPYLQRISQEIGKLSQEMETLKAELTPRILDRIGRLKGINRDDQQMNLRVAQMEAQMKAEQFKTVGQQADEQLAVIKDMFQSSTELELRQSEVESLEETTKKISDEIHNIELNQKMPDRIALIQSAIIPDRNSAWVKSSIVGGISLLTFLLSLFAIAFWDYQVKHLNEPKDLSRNGLRLLGSIPSLRGGMLKKPAGDTIIADSIDSIRTAILFGDTDGEVSSVVVTSAVGHEGKSTVASQLAVSLARAGRRTLLIDGDIRNPQQHLVFGLGVDVGLCELLKGQTTFDAAVKTTPAEGLWILPAGRCDVLSLQALAGNRIAAIMTQAQEQYDVIVVDSGPVLTGPEAMIYGRNADGAVISTRRDVSRLSKVEEARDRLQSIGVRVLGAVANGADIEVRETPLAIAAS